MTRRARISAAVTIAVAGALVAAGAAVAVASVVVPRAIDRAGAADGPAAVTAFATPERTGGGCTRDRTMRRPAAARALVERAAASGCPWARDHVDAMRNAEPPLERPRGDLIASTEAARR